MAEAKQADLAACNRQLFAGLLGGSNQEATADKAATSKPEKRKPADKAAADMGDKQQ